ncbi:WXG100 family type VII secretion target [Actinoplanes derwentensis]|nr:hypothetical protein [Actinoplanes derwentensis]
MVVSGEVRVDPPILEAAAGACDELQDRLRQSSRNIEPETEVAMAGLPGWSTRGALESLMWAWNDDATRFATYLGSMGDALNGCARDYRHTDHANAALFDIRGR